MNVIQRDFEVKKELTQSCHKTIRHKFLEQTKMNDSFKVLVPAFYQSIIQKWS